MKGFLFLILLIPIISCSPKEHIINHRKEAKIKSEKQIVELHDGVLLVRLSTKKNTIAAMKKAGKIKLANKTETKLKERNQLIINAFRNNFNYCPVYFFYSDYSKYVTNNHLENVIFLNDSLELDQTIKTTKQTFFIAEFGAIYPDTTKYATRHYYGNGKKEVKHYGGSEITVTALIIKDNHFAQLKEPFPYYVRERKGMPFQRSIHQVVLNMNFKLKHYYKEITKQ